jgi:Ca-activated chloride channel homolog
VTVQSLKQPVQRANRSELVRHPACSAPQARRHDAVSKEVTDARVENGGRMRRYTISAFVALLAAASLLAQSSVGTIRGTVKDPSGGVLPGATVRLSHATDADRTTITDAKGEFSFLALPPGPYTITVALSGFTQVARQVAVQAGAVVRLSLELGVGGLTESVAVTAASPTMNARTSSVVVGGKYVAGGVLNAPPPPPAPGFNTEAYDRISDNQWHNAASSPLSTFSADVDTASYSNVRRFLNLGQAPPKDAVRIEELINYFSFNYADPRDGRPFSVTTAIGDCPWNPKHRLALVGLQARRIDATHIPPRNLVFLIDVSGSMFDPRKLPLVKASLAMLAPNLTDKDRVAIVVYAGNTGLVLPSTSGGDTPTILDALRRLEAGGSTNGGAGLMLAYRVAQDHFIKGGVNRVILATDGDFNVGVTDQGSLLRLVEEKRASGVALSVLGYGMGNVKDSTMVKLADAGNGNYAYIDSLAEAQKVLVEQAGGTLVTVAKDVKLQIEFNPRVVGAYRLIGYEKRILEAQDFNNDRKDAGEIGAGHSVTALYELIPAGQPMEGASIDPLKYQTTQVAAGAPRGEAMTVKIRYKAPDGDVSTLMTTAVADRTQPIPELGFAAAVVEFGMLLRDSEFKGASSFSEALALAQRFKGDDPHGHRAEFIRLIGAAEGVSRVATTARR